MQNTVVVKRFEGKKIKDFEILVKDSTEIQRGVMGRKIFIRQKKKAFIKSIV